MTIDETTVYLFRTNITETSAPFGRYRAFARNALSHVDFDLPETGTILLKANATILFPAEKRVVTHPGFLTGIGDILIERGISPDRIVIGDGQLGERPDIGQTWEGAGYRFAVEQLGARLAPLNETEKRPVVVPNEEIFDRLPIYTEVTDCGFFFNVPLTKCHNLGCTTLSMKNLMGILGRPERHLCAIQDIDKPFEEDIWKIVESGLSQLEDRFYRKLCDTLVGFRSLGIPSLCIVDGLIGRNGTGFNEGHNQPLGWTLIGRNEVHVDAIGTYLMGLDPTVTPYLQYANNRDLGEIDPNHIAVVDLESGQTMDTTALDTVRSPTPLMPICRCDEGYYNRFRDDGSVVPWRVGDVNKQRIKDGHEPIPYPLASPNF